MRNVVMFLSIVFGMVALVSFPVPDRGPSGQPDYTGAAAEAALLDEEAESFVAGARSTGTSNSISRRLVAMQDDDDEKGAGGDEGEREDEGSGFDRLWDVTCCG